MEEFSTKQESKHEQFSFSPIKEFFHLKIVQNSGIYIAGNFLQKFLIFLLIPVYTYFLSPEDFGITGLATTVESVLVILFGFGIKSSIARYYYDFYEDKERLKQYISASFLFLFLAAFILTISLQLFGDSIWKNLTSGQIPFSPYIIMVIWSSYALIIVNFVTTLYQTQQNARAFVAAQIASVLLNIIFTILFVVVFQYGAKGQLFGRLISSAIMAIILSGLLVRNWLNTHIRSEDLLSSLAFGFPLIFHGLFSWAVSSIDRIMLEPYIPLAELGFYNLGYQVGNVLTSLLISINLAWVPYYYSIMKEDNIAAKQKIRLFINLYVIIFGFICLLGLLFNREVLHVISPPQYQNAAIYIPLILFAALFNGYYFMFSTPIFYKKKTIWIPIMTGTTALLNIILNMIWIPRYGALGSAWATLVGYFVLTLFTYILGQYLQPIQLPLGRICLLNVIIAISTYSSTYLIDNPNWGIASKLVILTFYSVIAYYGFLKSGQISMPRIHEQNDINNH